MAEHYNSGEFDMGAESIFKIDSKLLIDPQKLRFGPMISDANSSLVFEGWYKLRPVAIKVIQPCESSALSPKCKKSFEREVIMLSKVKHANIVRFIGACVEPTMMIITELMRGGTLQKYLFEIRPNCPDLEVSMIFALEISRAMEYLHGKGIIHRDLKPSNFLLTEDRRRIKLADFGLARDEAMGEMTTEAGTGRYMAPELFSMEPLKKGEKKHYDHKVDVYSFSMVLWELLTNKTPFKGMPNIMVAYSAAKDQRPSIDGIPKDLATLLQSCWAKDSADRPEFMQITEILTNWLHDRCASRSKLVKVQHKTSEVAENAQFSNNSMNQPEETKKTKCSCCSFLAWIF